MSRLVTWWRRVFGEPAPLEFSAMKEEERAVEIPPDRQAVIDALAARQHDQANEITVETGRAYITDRKRQRAEAAAVHDRYNERVRESWRPLQPDGG